MKLTTTTGDFGRCAATHRERMRLVREAGFSYADLSLYHTAGDPLFGEGWEAEADALAEYAREIGLTFVQAHAPAVNPLTDLEDALARTTRAVRIFGRLGISPVVIHGGYDPVVTAEADWFRLNRDFFRQLFPVMEACGVNLLVENSAKINMPVGYYPICATQLRSFVEYADHPLLHACWDTGHANIQGDQYEEIRILGKELRAIHFNDNRGRLDEHIFPFMGTMSIEQVMHGLLDIGFPGPFTLECDSALRPADYWLGDRRRFPGDDRLANAPLVLRREAEKLLYQTGKVILEAYGLWEA